MSNQIADLHPLFQAAAKSILTETSNQISPSTIRAVSTFRSLEEQASYKASGLSGVLLGWHNFGLAMDVAILTPEGVYLKDGSDPRYRIFGTVAQQHGCLWGGLWQKPDWDHCEFHGGFSLKQYKDWLDSHRIQ